MKKELQQAYGWFWLGKEVADYTNTTFFDVLDKSANEVLSLVMVMNAKIEYLKMGRKPM